ncbi:MAG TPA: hypothetical protein VL069_07870 [Opitutus sp.]|nr:hypothetical protein [Opitutus sp.]
MDTLYVLCRSVDRRHDSHMEPADADEACDQKLAYFEAEAKVNPLVKEILAGGTITCDGLAAHDSHGFLQGPATFFRTHEILRKTQRANSPLYIGGREYSHDEVTAMFDRCIPNAKLAHLPWWSFGRFRMSLGLAWALTLVVAHISARGQETDEWLDPFVLYYSGSITTVAALVYTTMKQNRDVRHAAPWNSAMYLDVNADLIRQNSPVLAFARKEFVPQEKPFKTSRFYYSLARRIESRAFATELLRRQSAAQSPAAEIPLQNSGPISPDQTRS